MLSIFASQSSKFSLTCHWRLGPSDILSFFFYIRNVHGQLLRQCLSWWPPVQIVGFGYLWLRSKDYLINRVHFSVTQYCWRDSFLPSSCRDVYPWSSDLLFVLFMPHFTSNLTTFWSHPLLFVDDCKIFTPIKYLEFESEMEKKLPIDFFIDLTHAIYPTLSSAHSLKNLNAASPLWTVSLLIARIPGTSYVHATSALPLLYRLTTINHLITIPLAQGC